MSLPFSSEIEQPILQELSAVGGTDNVKFLYPRLISYFPSLSDAEILEIQNETNQKWRKIVQSAGKNLSENDLIRRNRGVWTITERGSRVVAEKRAEFSFAEVETENLTHGEIQEMTAEIGRILGFYAEKEFEFYDVIWRENAGSQRISHVFEVQSKGNIDSAFAKLKRAFDAQRSKPFLIVASETDTNRAKKSLLREFSDLQNFLTILSFSEIKKIRDHLREISPALAKFLEI